MSGRYERKKPKKKGGKIALIVVCVLIVLICAGMFAGWTYYNSILGKMNKAEVVQQDPENDLGHLIATMEETTEATTVPETTVEETTVPPTEPPMKPEDIVNILVVGQSYRKGEESRMADSTMLVTINKYTKTVTLSSVLRDAFVKYPAYKGGGDGRCKVASAYAVAYSKWGTGGAMEVMNLMMDQNFGVGVDYNFEINMEMFIKFIDAIGGIQLELNEAEAKYLNKEMKGYCEVYEGLNSLDGFTALAFARMRKAEGDNESDIKRTARQRYLVESVIKQVTYILSTQGLGAIQNLANETLPYVTTNMENSEITKLMMEVIPILPELTFESGTLPVSGTAKGEMLDIYGDGMMHSILRFDAGQQKKLMAPITEGIFE